MQNFLIKGGKPLQGAIKVSGSKNAALPIMCASLLTKERVTLHNIPDIADIHTLITIFQTLGVKVSYHDHTLTIDASEITKAKIPEELVKKMRASILIVGGLLPRVHEVEMAFPGGCVLGKRSVAAHTHVFEAMGAEILEDQKHLHLRSSGLKGATIILPEMSVTATENAVMAAVCAQGATEIRLAATEPHVQDLCHFLVTLGAQIEGIGTNTLKIQGVPELSGGTYTITGDYLEAGTFIIAAVATRGDVRVSGINPEHLDSVLEKLAEFGAHCEVHAEEIHVRPGAKCNAIPMLRTAVYPSFPTDLQAPFTVLLTQAHGVSKIFETLFEGRLNYLFELEKMGAHVEYLNPHQALILGPTPLKGLPISSWDIRAGAAMVVAALIAEGETEISNINYINRGYEKLDEKLRALGADITLVQA